MRTLVAIVLVLLNTSAVAQSPHNSSPLESTAEIRAYLEPENGIFVGQLVRLWIEIKSTGRFDKAPRYPDLDVDGAIAIMPEQLGVNFSEREGDQTLVGQRQRYAIIPQRAGELRIPAITVNMTIMGEDALPKKVSLRTEAISFAAEMPPGTEGMKSIVTVPKIDVEESYNRDFQGLTVGDAITRTITMSADGTLALALPRIAFPEQSGAQVYPAKTIFEDKINRGTYRAKRTDAATYVLTRSGEFSLPPVEVSWFDPDTKTLKSEELPGIRFLVQADPLADSAQREETPKEDTFTRLSHLTVTVLEWLRKNIAALTLACILLYVAVLIWNRYAAVFISAVRSAVRKLLNSEHFYFYRFRQACMKGQDDEVIKTFWRWLDSLTPLDRTATIEYFSRSLKDKHPLRPTEKLVQGRYGSELAPTSLAPNTREVYRIVSRFRHEVLQTKVASQPRDALQLNPRSPIRGGGLT